VVLVVIESIDPEPYVLFTLAIASKDSTDLKDPIEGVLRHRRIPFELRKTSAEELCYEVKLPLDVHTDEAVCDIQLGHVRRPTHASSSWDAAKFEVCAHRFVDVAEPSFGVAVLNDGRYGHALQGDAVRVSLLRAAKYPDPTADHGRPHLRLWKSMITGTPSSPSRARSWFST